MPRESGTSKKTAREFLLFFVVALVIIQATYVFLRCYGSQFYEIVLEFYFFNPLPHVLLPPLHTLERQVPRMVSIIGFFASLAVEVLFVRRTQFLELLVAFVMSEGFV